MSQYSTGKLKLHLLQHLLAFQSWCNVTSNATWKLNLLCDKIVALSAVLTCRATLFECLPHIHLSLRQSTTYPSMMSKSCALIIFWTQLDLILLSTFTRDVYYKPFYSLAVPLDVMISFLFWLLGCCELCFLFICLYYDQLKSYLRYASTAEMLRVVGIDSFHTAAWNWGETACDPITLNFEFQFWMRRWKFLTNCYTERRFRLHIFILN